MIGGKAKQWKRNMYRDLNDETKMAYPWNNWETFKTNFKNNWGEIDSPGAAITKIYKLHKQKKKILLKMHPSVDATDYKCCSSCVAL